MKKHMRKPIRSWPPLSAWTGCIGLGENGELRFSLFAQAIRNRT